MLVKMKTKELTGAALGWAVKMAESEGGVYHAAGADYSISWDQVGKIIERESIGMVPSPEDASVWIGSVNEIDWGWRFNRIGPTPLIAAMRCYVASKLGDEVEIPEELK
jgi:hypothetical protein